MSILTHPSELCRYDVCYFHYVITEWSYRLNAVTTQNMSESIKELSRLRDLLAMEKEEDLEQYRQKIEAMPLHRRREEGYSWYPLQLIKKGYTIGERAFVVVERSKGLDEEHHFRSGKTVRLFTEAPDVSRPERSGVVYWVNKNQMHIILNAKDLPEWVGLGALGVDVLFDETTYQEMEKALMKVMEARQGRLAELREVLYGHRPARYEEESAPVGISSLNDSQNRAVETVLAARDIAIIHGPPGTGKTTTLVQAVRLLSEREGAVLVTAPSNTAVDLLTERLAAEGLAVVRIGNISRVDEDLLSHTLEMRVADHPESRHIKKVKIQAAEARRQARRYKRRFGRKEAEERRRLFREARELTDWANQLEDRLIDRILDSAQVITCTLVGSAQRVLERRKFRTVVIDEAAQALEPATWIPILRASRVVLTGDPFQLPPTVKSVQAQREGLSVTLIEKCLERLPRVQLLEVQYRMHELIMGFSNQQFYDGKLRADESVARHQLPADTETPVVFIDTAGCGFSERLHEAYQSRYNPEEFQILCEHLYQLLDTFNGAPPPDIALISPYREQVHYMEERVEEDIRLADVPLTINTIDGFQGQERDVVYLSLVRSNDQAEIGFLSDYRRMNVAMTRARKKLIIVGDSATVGGNFFYEAFLKYCEENGAYRTAWEFMREGGDIGNRCADK